MSSQDKDDPQDGTEDAAADGRTPDGSGTWSASPQGTVTDGGADIEDAEFTSDPTLPDDETDGETGGDGTPDDTAEMDTFAETETGTEAEDGDSPDLTDDAPGDDPDVSEPDAADADTTDAETRDGLAAAALAGAAAGTALGAGTGDAGTVSAQDQARPAASPAPAPQKSGGGFMPALLGGVVAAGIGAGAVFYLGNDLFGDDEALQQALAAQDGHLSALDAKLADLSDAMAASADTGASDQVAALGDRLAGQLGGVADRIETLAATVGDMQGGMVALGDRLGTLDTRLADVNDRLGAVEKRPLTESSEAAQAAFSAYEKEIADLRAALAEQTTANEALAAQLDQRATAAQAEVDAAAARAAELQAQADEQARVAMEQAEARARAAAVREALVGLDGALEKGTPFEKYVSVLSDGAEVPQALIDAAASGVATLPDLRAAFPDLARDALDASIRETVQDDLTERAVAFLKSQTGFRSLAPRDGDDPDAVLSRAEAALREGDLGRSISELSQLPPAGQAVMADWVARAEQRRTVTEATATLAANLLAN